MINESGPKKILDLSLDFFPGVLNFFSSRSAFFITPVKKKESINPFFKLLDSSSKNTEMP